MCSRRSCCGKPGGQDAGIAAAVLIVAAIAAVKIGPIVAHVIHIAIEVLRIAALTAVTVLAATFLAWLTVRVMRWWLCHRAAHRQTALRLVTVDAPDDTAFAANVTDCLGCGGSKTVLWAIGGSRYQTRPCPVCEPAERAG